MKLTRRELAATLAGAAAVTAQTPETGDAPQVRAAQEELATNRDAIGKVDLDYQTQPAFAFRAQ